MENRLFDHERLDVYQAAIAFVILSDEILEKLPRGRAYLVDQLQREKAGKGTGTIYIGHGHVLVQWFFFVRYEAIAQQIVAC